METGYRTRTLSDGRPPQALRDPQGMQGPPGDPDNHPHPHAYPHPHPAPQHQHHHPYHQPHTHQVAVGAGGGSSSSSRPPGQWGVGRRLSMAGRKGCSKVFITVYMGLMLATAGFCLSLSGWFAPTHVLGVRLAGPILLSVGLIILLFSCLLCAVAQHRCCNDLLLFYKGKRQEARDRRATAHLAAQAEDQGTPHPLIYRPLQAGVPDNGGSGPPGRYYMAPGIGPGPCPGGPQAGYSNHAPPSLGNHAKRSPHGVGLGVGVGARHGGACAMDTEEETEVDDSSGTPSTIPLRQPCGQEGLVSPARGGVPYPYPQGDYDPRRLAGGGGHLPAPGDIMDNPAVTQSSTPSPYGSPQFSHRPAAHSSPYPTPWGYSRLQNHTPYGGSPRQGAYEEPPPTWSPPLRGNVTSNRSPQESRLSPLFVHDHGRPAPTQVHQICNFTHAQSEV